MKTQQEVIEHAEDLRRSLARHGMTEMGKGALLALGWVLCVDDPQEFAERRPDANIEVNYGIQDALVDLAGIPRHAYREAKKLCGELLPGQQPPIALVKRLTKELF